jgi:hemerythrin-like metal-binding protein
MDRVVWTENFSVGIPLIDGQHQQLIEMINSLADTHDAENIFNAILEMHDYAGEHFSKEEEMMKRCNYKGLDVHMLAHKSFCQKTTELAKLDFSKGEHSLDVFVYLCDWLINHILTMDMDYRESCRSNLNSER